LKAQFEDTYKLLRKLSSCTTECKIYPEVTLAGNIHYHGLFNISDKIKWYKSVLPTLKRNGFVKVVKVVERHRDKWVRYIVKERDSMVSILELDPQLFDYNGLNLRYRNKVPKSEDINESTENPGVMTLLRNGDAIVIDNGINPIRLVLTM
jgi:hypothetical protein